MLGKIIAMPFKVVASIIGLALKIAGILISGILGLLGFVLSRVFGTAFGAVTGLLLGKKHLRLKLFSGHKKPRVVGKAGK